MSSDNSDVIMAPLKFIRNENCSFVDNVCILAEMRLLMISNCKLKV